MAGEKQVTVNLLEWERRVVTAALDQAVKSAERQVQKPGILPAVQQAYKDQAAQIVQVRGKFM